MTVSPMLNKFEFSVNKTKTAEGKLHLHADIVVDGVVINKKLAIDWKELTASCKKTGSYYVLTCGCGDPGCGGIEEPTMVTVWENRIRWRMPYPEPAREYQFDRMPMIKLIYNGILTIKQEVEAAGFKDIYKLWANYPVGPLGTDHATIEACLDILHEIIQQSETEPGRNLVPKIT